MNNYKVFVRGENFLLSKNGVAEKLGFYTTRFVEASDEQQAEEKVISMLRAEPWLRDSVLNEQSDPPMMFVEDISLLASFEGLNPPGAGFTFYPESGRDP